MAVDTVVDAELWLILPAMIGWITLGCFMTARHRHHGPRQSRPGTRVAAASALVEALGVSHQPRPY